MRVYASPRRNRAAEMAGRTAARTQHAGPGPRLEQRSCCLQQVRRPAVPLQVPIGGEASLAATIDLAPAAGMGSTRPDSRKAINSRSLGWARRVLPGKRWVRRAIDNP